MRFGFCVMALFVFFGLSACGWQEKPVFKKHPAPKMIDGGEAQGSKAEKCNCERDLVE